MNKHDNQLNQLIEILKEKEKQLITDNSISLNFNIFEIIPEKQIYQFFDFKNRTNFYHEYRYLTKSLKQIIINDIENIKTTKQLKQLYFKLLNRIVSNLDEINISNFFLKFHDDNIYSDKINIFYHNENSNSLKFINSYNDGIISGSVLIFIFSKYFKLKNNAKEFLLLISSLSEDNKAILNKNTLFQEIIQLITTNKKLTNMVEE